MSAEWDFMEKIRLKGGKIFDGEKFFCADIQIENGKITAVEPIAERESQKGGAPLNDGLCIDVTDCIVTSGLVDIHGHFSEMGNAEFGFPADLSCIPFGVTYAVDACAVRSDPSVLESLRVETKVFIPVCICDGKLDTVEMQKLLDEYGERAIGIKVYFDESLQNGTTEEIFQAACEFARERGLKVMVHSSYSPTSMLKIVQTLKRGDILTHSYHGGVHSIDENGYIAYHTAKEKGVVVDAGMAGGVHTDFEVLKKAIENGCIPDTISSDITKFSAYKRGGIYGLTVCMSILKNLEMDEIKIFQAVTKNAAESVGQKEWFSTLSVGQKATLCVLRYGESAIDMTDKAGNRLAIHQGYLCKMTMKNGQILYRN